MQEIPEIKFEEIAGRDGNLGLITLTRQQVLNALNHTMINALNEQLAAWEAASHIKAVVIRAEEGRAFCAGGDIRLLYESKMAGEKNLVKFFHDEYQLNQRIRHYLKPYVALIDGITMGGGVGISVHASHRVATNRLVWAMPEAAIGFYPDVGTTYVLARLPHYIGIYLALTGERLNLNDCIALNLIDYFVAAEQFPELIYTLADTAFNNEPEAVSEIIKKFSALANESQLWHQRKIIEKFFSGKTIEDIIAALEETNEIWCQKIVANLRTKSPTSLKVILAVLQRAAELDFDEAIQKELQITTQFLKGHDFFEGIRTRLIDKNQTPQWKPAHLKSVTTKKVSEYFL